MKKAMAALAALLLVGCGTGGPAAPAEEATLTVFAAASMKTTFTELGAKFEAAHPGVTVTFNFAGSQDLVDQILNGAAADVFAAANESTMQKVVDGGLAAADPVLYATNSLMIAVPPDNPANIAWFPDLAKDGLNLVICAPEVPCGAATVKVEEATGITLNPVSEEQAVSDVLAKVQSGEADAGLVYATDVLSAGDTVLGIQFDEAKNAVNNNPIVVLKDAPQAELAQAFVDLVLSDEGQELLQNAGFGKA
ncbi:MAG: molybdate ABC transporter substrate-binding protein [Propionibacteriaceae bacterium]|jgi:molybdate transport system substrate-binding protein|nr:molybdate ABC transporter substrate-binding protein [Propionibacteriaceae bacterium]